MCLGSETVRGRSGHMYKRKYSHIEVTSPNEAGVFAELSQTTRFDQFMTPESRLCCLCVRIPQTIFLWQHS